jgi:ribosomal-protein-alanine N-acetyltransferase
MSLRAATDADAQAMAVVHRRSFADPWAADEFQTLLLMSGVFGLVLEKSATLVGVVLGRTVADESEILTVCVDPEVRGRGFGAALIRAAMALAAQAGAAQMFLEVAEDNGPALAAYARAGFRHTGRRPDYYQRPGAAAADALTLRADLNSRPA